MIQPNAYIADILDQPSALRDTVAALPPPLRELRELATGFRTGKHRRLVLTGMGASHAALNYLLFRLTPHGYCPLLVETGELLYDSASLIDDATVLVVVSQSGRTAEVVKLVQAAAGRPIIAITNEPESPLAKAAAFVYITRAGVERSVPCKTYVATLAAMSAFAADFTARDRTADLAAIASAADAIGRYLVDWEDKARELAMRLGWASSVLVCGRGWSLCSAHAGAMVLREAARVHAEAVSGAQFRHGHMEMIRSGAAVLAFRGGSSTAELQDKLAADIRAKEGSVVLVGADAEGAAAIPARDQALLPFLEIQPPLLASIGLAWQHGLDPGVFSSHPKVQE
jgi:glucosamine--fructose-6-phosphate aminotransferase (isomerizing)